MISSKYVIIFAKRYIFIIYLFDIMAPFACLKFGLFGLFFQPEQYFSLTTIQPEQCISLTTI